MKNRKEVKNQWQKRRPQKVRAKVRADVEAVVVAEAKPIGTEATRRLCEEIAQLTSGTCLLGFSRGKDSIAAWIYLKQFFHTIIPFHCAAVPHLSFVNTSLDYYEDVFKTKITRCLGGEISTAIQNLIFQPLESEDEIDALELWKYDNHDIAGLLREQYGADIWCAFGINMTDSIDRRIYVKKNQGRNEERKTFYPCFDWTRGQIMEVIDRAGIKLPGDYRLANRSLSGIPSYRHLLRMQEIFPDDMRKIETLFPFIRAQLARNEFRAERQKDLASREKEKV